MMQGQEAVGRHSKRVLIVDTTPSSVNSLDVHTTTQMDPRVSTLPSKSRTILYVFVSWQTLMEARLGFLLHLTRQRDIDHW
jgi:hypothetical protein